MSGTARTAPPPQGRVREADAAHRTTLGNGVVRNDANPFRMPSDDEVLELRERQRGRVKEEAARRRHLSVVEKTTASSQFSRTSKEILQSSTDSDITTELGSSIATDIGKIADVARSNERLRDREKMHDFIQKKREMFLVQMSLDTKRREIKKLEDHARHREQALERSEQMLEEDAVRFEAFLKENDFKAVEAIKWAEAETKAKAEKTAEIKKLNAQIQAVKSDLQRIEEQLEDCKKYKEFLDQLTPEDWILQQQSAELEKKGKAKGSDQEEQHEQPATEKIAGRSNESAQSKHTQLFFREPQQLLDIFQNLEERNLFLIQNSQETEEAAEELRRKYAETRADMEARKQALCVEINDLDKQIEEEEARLAAASQAAGGAATSHLGGQDALGTTLDTVRNIVTDIYHSCDFESDATLSTLDMLKKIESKLEEYLKTIDSLPAQKVQELEKAKEKERRERVRQEKLLLQKKKQEERMKIAMERAQAPIHKKKGKPVMFRSYLAKPGKAESTKEDSRAEEDDTLEFFR